MKAFWRAVALALGSMGVLAVAGPGPNPRSASTGARRDISAFGRLAFKTFTDRDGLPQNGIWTLAVDRDGYVWAGTPGGLARYNGYQWTSFVLPSKNETFWINQGATAFTSDGGLWFGTRRAGAFRWKGGKWHEEGAAQGLPGDNVNAILESRWPDARGHRRLWIATYDGGLAYRDDQVWHPLAGLPTRRLFCLAETRQGEDPPMLWVGTDQG
ncbi:MAG TPA: two-component regulator propeller domain-containing protein, partial [Holophagaceae bacterium]|nr:two-component regulator propeller domain-containing protein [Holophagaceae bacterium]